MFAGYNTNGFAHHRLEDALAVLGELGYRSVALTLDHYALSPFSPDVWAQAERVRALLDKHRLGCVVETGARFLLDPRRKHQPTLLDPLAEARRHRLDFLLRSIEIAERLRADAVSFWSGAAPPGEKEERLFPRLLDACRELCDHADRRGVRLAFEPEPGMLIDTMPRFEMLHSHVAHPRFGLTLDVGHLYCTEEDPVTPHLRQWRDVLWNVHIEDMRRGAHDHLMFGEGEVDFREVFAGLREVGYKGGVHVELSRHSHDAVETARRSLAFLREHGAE
jgi:L-ribulose-5-phosphate 3-epimerase